MLTPPPKAISICRCNIARLKYQECIDAARKALRLKPDYPEAYNNIAAAYEAMSMWIRRSKRRNRRCA